MANNNHDASRMDIMGRCLAMHVGKLSHSYHPKAFYTVPSHQGLGCIRREEGGDGLGCIRREEGGDGL